MCFYGCLEGTNTFQWPLSVLTFSISLTISLLRLAAGLSGLIRYRFYIIFHPRTSELEMVGIKTATFCLGLFTALSPWVFLLPGRRKHVFASPHRTLGGEGLAWELWPKGDQSSPLLGGVAEVVWESVEDCSAWPHCALAGCGH